MAILINQKDCNTTRKNLGIPDCVVQNGRITGKILTSPSWEVNLSSGTFDKDYINEQIQNGTFTPVLGAIECVNNTPEATTEEYQGGIMSVVRNGLPQLAFKFIKGGWAFARALYSYNSQQAFGMLLVFEDGSIAGYTDGTVLKGFSLGMLNSGTYMHTDGATSGSVTTTVQLISTTEYNLDAAVVDRSTLGFDANTLKPITDITMTGRADVSEDKIYFKANFTQNQATQLAGIAIANLKLYLDGVADTIVALSLSYNTTTKEWVLESTTPFTTSTKVVVELYDSVNSIDVAKIGNVYYKGTTGEITPVA
jgi:hypothetical protein